MNHTERLAAAGDRMRDLNRERDGALAERNAAIVAAVRDGVPKTRVADLVGVSLPLVYVILKRENGGN
jgi:hypothetical protein